MYSITAKSEKLAKVRKALAILSTSSEGDEENPLADHTRPDTQYASTSVTVLVYLPVATDIAFYLSIRLPDKHGPMAYVISKARLC